MSSAEHGNGAVLISGTDPREERFGRLTPRARSGDASLHNGADPLTRIQADPLNALIRIREPAEVGAYIRFSADVGRVRDTGSGAR
jgi:hypothetical protein